MFEYPFMHRANAGFSCIGIDLRGLGMSDKPWWDYSYRVFADDVQKVMNVLKLEWHFGLVGFSMGGAVAMRYVAKYYPNTISHLILTGAAAPSLTKRKGHQYGHDKTFCDGIIAKLLQNRPKTV
ncbi:MAG TPA: alpha/beta fold hydrolase [Nitrososphaera sp.]|nr:alpha/beta fold hydrolase [Nitrososphaera sp.]